MITILAIITVTATSKVDKLKIMSYKYVGMFTIDWMLMSKLN